MELQIRYCTTPDGVSIAWGEMGQGPALLYFQPAPFSHVEQTVAINEALWDDLALSFRLILFDVRGTGMSERNVDHVSAETLLIDAEAVISAAQLDEFVAYCDFPLLAQHPALQLATAVPSRVSHLILEAPSQNMSELAETPYGRVAPALAESDWSVYVETVFRVLFGIDAATAPFIDAYAKAAASWVDAPIGRQYLRLMDELDLGDLFMRVRQPTLIRRSEPNMLPASINQRVAAKIPGAQYVRVNDPSGAMVPTMIRKFVASSEKAPPSKPAGAAGTSGTAIILFTDIADSTALTERIGDTAFRAAARTLDERIRTAVRECGGTPVEGKVLGDGVMGVFASAAQAIDAARRCLSVSGEIELPLHVGIHAGDVIREDGNVYGGAVNIASRVCGLCEPGEILVSATVRDLARTSAGVVFEDRGERELKGVVDPVRVFAVREGG